MIVRIFVAAVLYVLLSLIALTIIDRTLPRMASIPIPGGAVQTLRQPGGIYVETWFMGVPVVKVTLPVRAVYVALLIGACMLVVIEYWLLWRFWRRGRAG